ncbi:MAG: GAF domain-containing protein [Cytophagales bacterium]|nr:MAG: GAF domain-containing protein [Cytophagales bacterium]
MKAFKDLSLGIKFSVIIGISLSIVFAILITAIYYQQKSKLVNENDERFFSHLADFERIVDEQRKANEDKASIALMLAEQSIAAKGGIVEKDSLVAMPLKVGKEMAMIKTWSIGNQLVQADSPFVDNFYQQTGAMLGIVQKTSVGYVSLIASDVKNNNKMNRVGVPMVHKPLVDALNANSYFLGTTVGAASRKIYSLASKNITTSKTGSNAYIFTAYLLDNEYFTKKNIAEKKYLDSGFPYIMTKSGIILFHPNPKLIGSDLSKINTKIYQEMVDKTEVNNKISYTDQADRVAKYQYFVYYAPYDVFLSIVIPKAELIDNPLASIRNFLIIGAVIAIVLCNLFIGFFADKMSTQPIKQILDKLNKLAQGKQLSIEETTQKDEYGQIFGATNQLIERLNNASNFAKEVGKGRFDTHYVALNKEDDLGNALLEMRNDLKEASEKEAEQRWISEGVTKFNEIIRLHTNQINELTYQVLAELIKYVGANQGAIFLIDTDGSNIPCLELSASYAYKRRKYAKKQVYLGEGLIGQTWQEGEEIYLKKVPESYAKIGSGLGEAPPNSLFIVPLKFNEEIQGVLEIASFYQFSLTQKEFILKIMESLAAAVSVAKFNESTKKLLQESQYMMENLRSQEEEMRQNYEELQATQEELFRREQEAKVEKEELASKIRTLEQK